MDTMTASTDSDQPPRLEVDGSRPAVEWVTSLPKSWKVTSVERLVLLAIACDSYDGKEARPGWPLLSAATGIDVRDVRKAVDRLAEQTDQRPALLRVEENRGGSRARIVLLDPRNVGSRAPGRPGQPGVQPAGQPAGQPGVHSPTTLALALALALDLGVEEEEPSQMVEAVADLIAEVDPAEAVKVRRAPNVETAARKAVADGFGVADLLAVWKEQEIKGVRSTGPGLALHLFGRLGKPLPKTRGGTKPRASSPKPRPHTDPAWPTESSQTLGGWASEEVG
jgi:hypothetical protein